MPVICSVPGCNILKNAASHRFPSQQERKEKWLRIVGLTSEKVSIHSRICSRHFVETDYVFGTSRPKLNSKALPSRNLPVSIHETYTEDGNPERDVTAASTSKEVVNDSYHDLPTESVSDEINADVMITPMKTSTPKRKISSSMLKCPSKRQLLDFTTTAPNQIEIRYECELDITETTSEATCSAGNDLEQCDINKCNLCAPYIRALEKERSYLITENQRLRNLLKPNIFSLDKFCSNNAKILYYTGFQTYTLLMAVFKFCLPSGNTDDLMFDKHSNEPNAKTNPHSMKLPAVDQFFLTLMRLRRGLCLETVGDMFGISKTTADKIFITWINLMYLRLGSLNIWPHRNVLREWTTTSFRKKYPHLIGSIDCTEFFIQKPSSLVTQSQCFSHYKNHTTLKALVMVDPAGGFLYSSPLFTGSISDRAILTSSGFLNVLKKKIEQGDILPGDAILADKGFNVKDLLNDLNLEINIPVFKINGQQFSSEEVYEIRKIAQERIHVERAIGRLKSYRILSRTKIPISGLTCMQQIYNVCLILCNFRSPLISPKLESNIIIGCQKS